MAVFSYKVTKDFLIQRKTLILKSQNQNFMKISFHGAARTVTGSKHIIHTGNKQILLDCGMFQGMGEKTFELNNNFGFEATDIDIVIISHAHIDHIGLLPKLVKEGYKGAIYCTEATKALAEIMLRDSAHIQEMDVKYANKMKSKKGHAPVQALYNLDDALRVISSFKTVKYDKWIEIDGSTKLLYTDAGHILGSACVNLELKENGKTVNITFSGDIVLSQNYIKHIKIVRNALLQK